MNNEDLNLFRDMTIKALEAEILPRYEKWESEGEIPKETWKTLGEAGLLGVDIPEEYGGMGASIDVSQMIMFEMGRMCLNSLCTGYSIHANIVIPYINRFGSEEQKKKWLPDMIAGEKIGALAMTEPSGGSDVAGIKTKAVRNDEGNWILNGSKTFITNGIHADVVVVCAKTDLGAGAKGISLFLVDTGKAGFEKGKKIKKIGQHASDTAELFFEDVELTDDDILGTENHGFFHLMEELPRERLGCSAQSLGSCYGAIEMARNYVLERKAFGQSVSRFQNTRFKLAEAKAQTELCQAFFEKCVRKFHDGEMSTEDAAILKLTTSEAQNTVANECLQLFGGYGYTEEYPISRFFIDARVQTIYAGTSEIMKEVIARGMLGK